MTIETGRFTIPKTPESLKGFVITSHSTQLKMKCDFHRIIIYDDIRNSLFEKISERNRLFMNFDYHEKPLFLFNNSDAYICQSTAGFVIRAMGKRQIKGGERGLVVG